MQTTAVILSGPRDLGLGCLGLVDPTKNDLVVEIAHSGISTGTEKLFWSGTMPPFPGMGYPLVPGYEAAGEVVEAAPETGFTVGDYVFVPGANCFAPGDRGGDKNHRDRCREMTEIRYDMSDHTPVTEGVARDATDAVPTVGGVGMGCHAGPATMAAAARVAGNSELLDQYAADYPVGPHDKPQSMCPAFGSLRVGLRMWRVATLLSGSACCVYGLTFVSHFYGARRSVGYVPFNSESLVTGKLFEDIRDAVHEIADPANYDAVVVTNLCVPTASGVPLKLLPTQINGVRIVGIDVPGIGIPTHAEAKDVLAGAMLKYARAEIEAGPVVPCREWRELYAALDSDVVAAVHPFYTAAVREFQAAGRKVVGSAPVGRDGTMAWLAAIGDAYGISGDKIAATQNVFFPAITEAWTAKQIKGRITLSGYEGFELLVARLLIESGADVLYVGTACARTPWSEPDREWLESKGVAVKYRASLEDDCAAMEGFRPDLAIGITPVVQKGKQLGIPSLYFTNLISARPLMGPAGAGSLADVINGAIGNSARMEKMKGFFEGVGVGDTAGIWEGSPNLRPDYRAAHQKKIDKAAKLAKAEEMI